ncbi:ABC transporter permease [Kytococcus sedentarius]|uniref:ABC-type dipeptide/oligopeptide/nickel transport system, permease component n=1 Tax=Kytococcus sedentarius (strain ATCC 14392 / DSM 20547 / JCM 11482 / CCUG 33030 / NBRC 15357 / NCTC 11040 / CCM 314 / 541) TaxID=478801 RepID=C7NHD4_KYTSD|nr:ABC transporter permease [Kytococcus sedentarius]ACV06291.1 ABC-type dipeptide/oligopeptide/nickel transport system, permease component [Kytococcus sedentarius DSM 20547]QQB64625.1 ABC transporter permease [Kytococcus sedentarius]STX12290.1 Glutathione transport system permease protein gsiD [Kytococcus sedentarius]
MTERNQHEAQLEAEEFDLEHERASRVDSDQLSADPAQNERTDGGAPADDPNANVGKPRSLAQDAAADLIRNPMFIISLVLMLLMMVMALFPGIFTSVDPQAQNIMDSLEPARDGHPLGFDQQGHDIFARVVHGARASISVGVLTTLGVVLLGGAIGAIAGYFGGWIDAVLSRILDTFLAIPLLLAGIVVMSMVEHIDLPGLGWLGRNIPTVALMLVIFGWTSVARIMRGAVLQAKQADYVTAARSMGASTWRIITTHIIPNAIAPVIVIATISLGMFIVSEATLSYLGIGLDTEATVSWGGDISNAQRVLRTHPMIMFWPSLALSVCVLSFMLLGDAVRDALDPKLR